MKRQEAWPCRRPRCAPEQTPVPGPRAPPAAWDVTRCRMLLHSPPEGTGGSTAL